MGRTPATTGRHRSMVDALRPELPRDHDRWRPHGVVVDEEPDESGRVIRAATVFLTGSECPWTCVMCDLWQYTTSTPTPEGAIAAQVDLATREIEARGGAAHIKLYNAGSFFDARAVPDADVPLVASATRNYHRVIVESHPALVGTRTLRLLEHIHAVRTAVPVMPILEVAMGLETAHPGALASINKGLTIDWFRRAAEHLKTMGAGLRVFLLVHPPFVPADERDLWLARSVDEAIAAGAGVISLIPTRSGPGAMSAMEAAGTFAPPTLTCLERAFDIGLARPRPPGMRILADLWDAGRLAACVTCGPLRVKRLQQMNLTQKSMPPIVCARCAGV
jgi:radical SAM enzyme (TIGR01210 family)